MPWFTAKIAFESLCDRKRRSRQFCENQYFLLKARDEKSALTKANRYGKKLRMTYLNVHQQKIEWRLLKVVAIKELFDSELKDGTEVFYEFFYRNSAAAQHKRTKRKKSSQ